MRTPDFLIIGSAKSGTSTLYKYLELHPKIFMSRPKEPSYFANFHAGYGKDWDWYISLFEGAKPEQICGEASTPYTHQTCHNPAIPKLIQEKIPQVKMIYIMRHPVDRAYSQYLQQIKLLQGRHQKKRLPPPEIPETFEDLLARGDQVLYSDDYMERINVVSVSKYIDQIQLYLKYFPKESFLFLFFEDLVDNPQRVLTKIYNFLGIEDIDNFIPKEIIKANESKTSQEYYLRYLTKSSFSSFPIIKDVAKLFPQKLKDKGYEIYNQIFAPKQKYDTYMPKPMLSSTRKQLLEEFEESNHKLSEFLQRDLSYWND